MGGLTPSSSICLLLVAKDRLIWALFLITTMTLMDPSIITGRFLPSLLALIVAF